MRIDIGIGEFGVSSRPSSEIKTYALGSCVAVILWDKVTKVGGMIHVALPDSSINPAKATERPAYFVDTGIPLLLGEMERLGAQRRNMTVRLAGGANIMDANATFDIGRRNGVASKRLLWKQGLGVIGEDLGGNISRTVSLAVDTGTVTVSNAQKTWEL